MAKGAEGCGKVVEGGGGGYPNALSLKGTWEQQCEGAATKGQGQRPHGLENEFNSESGKGAKG